MWLDLPHQLAALSYLTAPDLNVLLAWRHLGCCVVLFLRYYCSASSPHWGYLWCVVKDPVETP
jgi:hypothetical protein